MTMACSTTNPSEANIFDTIQYLNSPSGNYTITTHHPRGGDSYIKNAVDREAYYFFPSAGSPTCVKAIDGSPVPATLINISPFTYSSPGAVRGQLTDHYRYLSLKPFRSIGADVDTKTEALVSIINPFYLSFGSTWSVYSFVNGTAPDPLVFELPAECVNAKESMSLDWGEVEVAELGWPYRTPLLLRRTDAVEVALALRDRWSSDDPKGSLFRVFRPSVELVGEAPSTIDNRDFAVGPVRDQSSCGGCWAFSTVVSVQLNYNYARKNSTLSPLSVQELLDCVSVSESDTSALIDCKGCFGGWPYTAMRHIVNRGIALEESYGYIGVTGASCLDDAVERAYPAADALYIARRDTDAMAAAVATHGSVVAVINVPGSVLQYTSGILDDPACCSGQAQLRGLCLQHAVVVVGYGTENSSDGPLPYWVVRNSWSEAWGDAGYIRFARGKDTCGIESNSVLPLPS